MRTRTVHLALILALILSLTAAMVPASPLTGVALSQTGSWETLEPLPEAMVNPSSVAVNGKIYTISSSYAPHDTSLNYEYDPVGDTWIKKATPPTSDRYGMGAAVYDNKVYLFGGVAHGGPLSNLAIYDPATDTWTTGTNMPSASAHATATLINGKIYVIGGTSAILQIYDPLTDSWTAGASMPTNRWGAAATAVDNKLYVIGGYSGATRQDVVEAYDPITDSWTSKTPMTTERYAPAAVASNGLIYVMGGSTNAGIAGQVEVYDPATDTWDQSYPDMPTPRVEFGDSSDAIINNVIYVVGGGGSASGVSTVVEALTVQPPAPPGLASSPWPMFQHDLKHTGRSPYSGPDSPALKWSFTTSDWIIASPAIGVDGTIYVGDNSQAFYAVNPDGSLQWSYPTGGHHTAGPAIGADGTIYVGSYDHNLYALNPDGSLEWSYNIGAEVRSSPAIANDGTIYVGAYDYHLYAINPDGSLKWRFPTADIVYSSPAIADDGTIYVGSHDGSVYAVNPDGSLKWSYPTAGIVHSSPAVGADGTVYVGSDDGKFYALNPSSGSQIWSYQTVGYIRSSPAIAGDGTIYVGSGIEASPGYDNKLYAFNPDGSLQWSYPTGHIVRGSPAVDASGTIYVGSYDDRLHAVNPDGSPKWSYLTGGNVYSNPVIGADGTVYVGSWDHKLYAIGEGTSNNPPDQPSNTGPGGGAQCISSSPVLQSSAFSDPDAGDTHAASQWQVTAGSGDYSSPAFDSGTDASNLTTITIPPGTLAGSAAYYWHVRHQDNDGAWSPWSSETSFGTADTPTGSDVSVQPSGASISFTQVTGSGCTSISTSQGNPGGPIPPNFRMRGQFVDIVTTATYTGNVTVGIRYAPDTPNPQNLKLFHDEGGNWVDVTTWVDTANRIVYGQVSSFSWFFIGGEWVYATETAPAFPNIYAGIAAAMAAAALAYVARGRILRREQRA